uniref:Putative capsid protein n=2 Tax=viral metagenome TaxID=1070528 RepID=A0A6M3KWP6_9ZZZZ
MYNPYESKSNIYDEQFTSAIGLGKLLEKPENEDIQADAPMESYTIVCKNRSWARKVRFSYESVKDSKKTANFISSVVASWGRTLPVTKEEFYAKFFNYGAYTSGNDIFNNTITDVVSDSSGALIYDGKAWFDDAHPDKVGGTYDNFNSSSSLSFDNLKTAYLAMTTTNNRDERGNIIDIYPTMLLIPGALKFTAIEVLQSEKEPDVFNNTINSLRNIITPVEWSYITGATVWFLGIPKMGLMATNREDVSLDFYQDEENLSYVARVFTRFGGAVTNWRYWYACNLDTA